MTHRRWQRPAIKRRHAQQRRHVPRM